MLLLLALREREREREPEQFDCDCVDQMWHGPAFILRTVDPKGGGALRRLPAALPFLWTIQQTLGCIISLFHQQQITEAQGLPPSATPPSTLFSLIAHPSAVCDPSVMGPQCKCHGSWREKIRRHRARAMQTNGINKRSPSSLFLFFCHIDAASRSRYRCFRWVRVREISITLKER